VITDIESKFDGEKIELEKRRDFLKENEIRSEILTKFNIK